MRRVDSQLSSTKVSRNSNSNARNNVCEFGGAHTQGKFILTTRWAKAHFEPKGAQSPRKSVIAVTKLSTFDISLNAVSSGSDG